MNRAEFTYMNYLDSKLEKGWQTMKMHLFILIATAMILVSAGIRLFIEKERKTAIAVVILGMFVFIFACLWLM